MLASPDLQRLRPEMQTTLLQVGKRPGQPLMAASAPGLLPSRLFYVTDRSNGFRFLVDTGAEVSVIPPSATDCKHRRTSLSLQAVNDSPIATYGDNSPSTSDCDGLYNGYSLLPMSNSRYLAQTFYNTTTSWWTWHTNA